MGAHGAHGATRRRTASHGGAHGALHTAHGAHGAARRHTASHGDAHGALLRTAHTAVRVIFSRGVRPEGEHNGEEDQRSAGAAH
eukprot:gene5849-biopygen3857